MTLTPRVEVHDAREGSLAEVPVTCGAKARNGGRCRQEAGWGTTHVGQGRCKLHGGATPIKHGRYSGLQLPRIADLWRAYQADPEPLNLLDDLAMARAILHEFLERHEAFTAALLAWHESYQAGQRPLSDERLLALRATLDEYEILLAQGPDATELQQQQLTLARETVGLLGTRDEKKPRQITDLSTAYQIVGEITRIVERIERIRAANAISRPDLLRVMTEMGRVVDRYVPDEPTRDRIRDGWLSIRVA